MFKGYNQLKLKTIFIKIWNYQKNRLDETTFKLHVRQKFLNIS
jgi:hypothetical protein